MDGKFLRNLPLLMVAFGLFGLSSGAALSQDPFSVVLVDKGQSKIHLAAYNNDRIEIKKSFHVTLGKALGDKEVEKDLKTPEGVYFFITKLAPPTLKKKFGKLALMMNYPNPIDAISGKTGYDIMLHATDDPPRLARDRDSEGCVVVSNEEISEISKYVRLGVTPIVIYSELRPEYLQTNFKPDLERAFHRWLEAWNSKQIDTYISSYADKFTFNGMNLTKYRQYKKSLNDRYATISVKAEHLRFYFHPKYDVVTFTQRYESTFKNGAKAFRSSGTKVLYFLHDGNQYRIANEGYSNLIED